MTFSFPAYWLLAWDVDPSLFIANLEAHQLWVPQTDCPVFCLFRLLSTLPRLGSRLDMFLAGIQSVNLIRTLDTGVPLEPLLMLGLESLAWKTHQKGRLHQFSMSLFCQLKRSVPWRSDLQNGSNTVTLAIHKYWAQNSPYFHASASGLFCFLLIPFLLCLLICSEGGDYPQHHHHFFILATRPVGFWVWFLVKEILYLTLRTIAVKYFEWQFSKGVSDLRFLLAGDKLTGSAPEEKPEL